MRNKKIILILTLVHFALFSACELGGSYEPPSYKVVYHPNGGEGLMESTIMTLLT